MVNIIIITAILEMNNQILLDKASHGSNWKYKVTQALYSQEPSISTSFLSPNKAIPSQTETKATESEQPSLSLWLKSRTHLLVHYELSTHFFLI